MTHDELLADLTQRLSRKPRTLYESYLKALYAVVELHKPFESQHSGFPGFYCRGCLDLDPWNINPVSAAFPCPTIKVIEKEFF
jgi:hypothetical protein